MIATRVLLVEDNTDDVELTLSFCASAAPHLHFTVVSTGVACWEALSADQLQPFDALVFDYTLPDSDGLTLLQEVVSAGYPAPVVIVTGRSDVHTAVAAMKAGAMDYLVKSSDYWEHLPRAIDSVVARYRLTRENMRLQGELATHARELEQAMRKAQIEQARLQAVLDQLPEGVMIVESPDGRIIAANHAAERLWGRPFDPDVYTREYPHGTAHLDGTPRTLDETPIAKVLHSGQPLMGDQGILLQPDGQQRAVLTNAAPLCDEQGEMIGVVAVFQDITELKRLEQLKDDILSIASHELKNPLTVILGYSSMLLQSQMVQQDARARRAADTIRQQSQRMRMLIERLLDLARLDLGRMILQLSSFDLAALVRSIAEQQQETTQKHRLYTRLECETLTIAGDYMRLEQVLINLVSNAIKYSPDGGDVILSVHIGDRSALKHLICNAPSGDHERFAVVQVRDHGIGIEAEAQQQLFSRFYRARQAEQLVAGQGLGLYISAEIVRMHGGVLCVESTLGRGSTFSILLPLPVAALPGPANPVAVPPKA